MTDASTRQDYARHHLRFGWWLLLVFASAGLALELLHGFKVRAYLDVSNETRRLMWTLAHAHGTLLGLVHIVFGLSLAAVPDFNVRHLRVISRSLTAASVLLPGGFFLAGMAFYSGDPGVGVLVVPAGAILLLVALCLTARGIPSTARPAQKFPSKGPRLQDR